jgi:hypothetical protein
MLENHEDQMLWQIGEQIVESQDPKSEKIMVPFCGTNCE